MLDKTFVHYDDALYKYKLSDTSKTYYKFFDEIKITGLCFMDDHEDYISLFIKFC